MTLSDDVKTLIDKPNFAHGGGSFSVTVTTPSGCPVAFTSFQPWVTLNSITPAGGITTVSIQVASNPGSARATSIVLANRLFHITQQ